MANQVAYGFHTLLDLFDQRVAATNIPVVSAAIEASVREHNRQLDAILSLFVQRTTDYSIRYRTPSLARLQPLGENGRARPIKPAGQYDIAFPLHRAGTAWGFGYEAGIKMTVEEANNATNTLLLADVRWMRDKLLAALYYGGPGWTFTDDERGALTVMGLANGDTVTYPIVSGADNGATDDHIIAQAAGIADGTNPYPTIHSLLMEHPENGGQALSLIPTNLRATTEALATFHPYADPNLRAGSGVTELVGSLGVATPGTMIGYEDSGVWIAEWRHLPDSYIVSTVTEGPRPIALREDTAPQLQGFNRVADRDDYPWYERQYLRKAGFGAYARTSAVVARIGNGTYAEPTGYESPMP